MCHIIYSTYAEASMYQGSSCQGFTLFLQLLKSKNSVQTFFAINNTFASSANVSKLLLLLRCFLARMRREQADSSLLFPLLTKALERCFPAGLHSLLGKFAYICHRIDQDILSRKSSHKDTPFLCYFGHSCWKS